MKKIWTAKKKTFMVLAVFIILVLCAAAGIRRLGERYRINWEDKSLTVTEDPQSGYSYVVYEDHVELLEYTWDEEDVIVPDALMGKPVTVIGEYCFYSKETMRTVQLGGNIREVGQFAFQFCRRLEQVTGDAELETISWGMFSGCHLLRTVDVGNRIRRIETVAFASCWALESIGEQPELEYIGEMAFYDAGPLPDFRIPEDAEVEIRAFDKSQWLRNWLEENRTEEFVILGAGTLVAYQGDAETVEIPYGVTKVDWHIFTYSERAEDIREIYLPETVTEVETSAFYRCSGIRVYIPESVTALDMLNLQVPHTEQGRLGGDTTELTIITTSGSYAEEYAKQYGLEYEIVEPWW